jgi:hypothetical protein
MDEFTEIERASTTSSRSDDDELEIIALGMDDTDSMDMAPIEHWCARSRAFALRTRERKARFYDTIASWLSPEVLHFVCAASAHMRTCSGAVKLDISDEDR